MAYGFTAPNLDLYPQDVIGARWQGRGPCMMIDDTEFDVLDSVDMEQAFMAAVLHELANAKLDAARMEPD